MLSAARADRPRSEHTPNRERECDGGQRDDRKPRDGGWKALACEQGLKPRRVTGDERATGLQLQHLEKEPHQIHEEAEEQNHQGREQDGGEQEREPRRDTQRPTPGVQLRNASASPDSLWVPESRGAIDRGERRTARANTVPRNDINLDAGFLQCPQDAGMVGTVRTGACQNKGGATGRRIGLHQLLIVDRVQLHQLEAALAAGRRDVDFVTLLLVEDCAADG